MKKSIFSVGLSLMALCILAGCGNKSEEKKTVAPKKDTTQVKKQESGNLPNFRFVDSDSIMLKYNLSVDFNEQMIRLQNNLAEEEKKQTSSLQSRANALQAKMNSAQSQADVDKLKSEYESLQNQQNQAQQKLAQMGSDMEKTLANNAQTVMDSLTNFLKDYATERGYDAVFVKNCAPYYDPALDVTDEVIEGLNARYNKVKK